MASPEPGAGQEAYAGLSGLKTRILIQDQYRTYPENWYRWVFRRLDLPQREVVLDLGCGLGDLWLRNIPDIPEGWRITLSDLSERLVSHALETLEATRPIFSGLAIDVQAIPFADHSFGAVIGLGLLDNVRNRSRCLDEIQQVLKPGGKFYASAGGRSHLQEIEELVRQFLPDADFGGSPERFGLENGEDLLSPWFSEIRLFRYEDELEFDTPEPLIAYALSEAYVEANLGGEEERLFRRHVEQVISRQGKVRVKSEKGLFEAIRYI